MLVGALVNSTHIVDKLGSIRSSDDNDIFQAIHSVDLRQQLLNSPVLHATCTYRISLPEINNYYERDDIIEDRRMQIISTHCVDKIVRGNAACMLRTVQVGSLFAIFRMNVHVELNVEWMFMLNWMLNELNVELNVEWIECWIECWMNWMFNWMLNELNVELNVEWIECLIECWMNWMLNWMLNELNVELNV